MLTAEGFHEIVFSYILSVYSLDKNTFKVVVKLKVNWEMSSI
jgi:hypothetical protein